MSISSPGSITTALTPTASMPSAPLRGCQRPYGVCTMGCERRSTTAMDPPGTGTTRAILEPGSVYRAAVDRIAVVTGANRGIGLQVAGELARRGYAVLLAARDADAGERAAARLRDEGLDVRARLLDVADQASLEAF